jgi:hypothetical protein
MDQTIRFIQYQREIRYLLRADIFKLNKERRAVWLQKLCFFILRKLGCAWYEPITEYHAVDFKTRSFVERLRAQHRELYDYVHRNGQRLIIGSADFDRLMETKTDGYFLFKIGADGKWSVFSLTVEVVPWMQGMVVLP